MRAVVIEMGKLIKVYYYWRERILCDYCVLCFAVRFEVVRVDMEVKCAVRL